MKDTSKKRSATKLTVSDFLIPVVSGIVFLLIVFFVLIPSINNSSEVLLEIEQVQNNQEIVRENLNKVEGLDFESVQVDLSNARKVLPRRLEVSQFAYYVNSLAREKGLTFRELRATDVDMLVSQEESSILEVKGVRVPMAYSGDYEPILDFFNELQVISPYVISFGHRVELSKVGLEDEDNVNWNLEIDITGYYVEEDTVPEGAFNPLVRFVPYNADEKTVEEFSARVERLRIEN